MALARPIAASLASLLALLWLAPLAAQDLPDLGPPETIPQAPAESGPVPETEAEPAHEADGRLDTLFAELADPENEAWEVTERQIWRTWARSGSHAMDLLLRRADKAAADGDLDGALLFLNDLVRLAPDFAEGWNKRATVHFMRDDYGRSVADIERTLALEPRHFGALAGLAVILERTGNEKDALAAWRQARSLHPRLEHADDRIRKLAPNVDGRDL